MSAGVRVLRDVARGATCRQSSVASGVPPEWADANRAVRGVKTGECSFRTELEDGAWWEVELRATQRVEAVVVYNFDQVAFDPSMTGGELREAARSLELAVRDAAGTWRVSYRHAQQGGGDFGGIHSGPLVIGLGGLEARAIRIQIAGRRHLNLDAVEVFAEEEIARGEALRELLAAANDHNFAIAADNLARLELTPGDLEAAASPAMFSLNDTGLGFVTQALAWLGELEAAERLAARWATDGVTSATFAGLLVRRELDRRNPALARALLEQLARAHPNDENLLALDAAIKEAEGAGTPGPVKLIIWDLDDTLWRGTFAEGDEVTLNEARAAMVRTARDRGIVCTIASKNDRGRALARLRELGLDEFFILPWFGFLPKGPAVAALIRTLQLRSPDCLFVDDNELNLEQARAAAPGLQVLNALDPAADDVLHRILAAAKPDGGERFARYRALETKVHASVEYEGDAEAFLRSCAITVAIVGDARNVHFADRVEELVNRSNQLNFTESRIPPRTAGYLLGAVLEYDCRTVWVRDKFGSYGLVGFAAFNRATREFEHFVLSCRVMNMHVENAVMHELVRSLPGVRPLVDPMLPDYIAIVDHRDPAFQEDFHAASKVAPDVRVMANCHSGVLIHYLALKGRCDPDSWPDVFSLEGGDPLDAGRATPYRHRVLLMASQYSAHAWEQFSVRAFTESLEAWFTRWDADGALSSILLSPDIGVAVIQDVAGRRWSHAELNAAVRVAAAGRPRLRLLELSDLVRVASDVSDDGRHYSRGLLRRASDELRRRIDADDDIPGARPDGART